MFRNVMVEELLETILLLNKFFFKIEKNMKVVAELPFEAILCPLLLRTGICVAITQLNAT
jgi:hypothetical protein